MPLKVLVTLRRLYIPLKEPPPVMDIYWDLDIPILRTSHTKKEVQFILPPYPGCMASVYIASSSLNGVSRYLCIGGVAAVYEP